MSGRILVVDDDRQMVRTLCDLLRLRGWESEGVHSGEAALEAVRASDFSVVLMDIKMGGINGVEALKRMRELRPGIRVILMTAYTAAELLAEAERCGVLRVLPKPVAIPQLLKLLEEVGPDPRPILVVDDDPQFLSTLADIVRRRGHPVLQATDIRDAVQKMERAAPAIVVLDLRLDGLDPRRGILAIRSVDPSVVLILYSGHPVLLRETATALPPDWIHGKLEKPFAPDRLLEMIDAAHVD